MFEIAGWNGPLPESADRVQRLQAARVTLHAVIPHAEPEEEEAEHEQRFTVEWPCVSVIEPQAQSVCDASPKRTGEAQIEIPVDGDDLKRIEVAVHVKATPEELARTGLKDVPSAAVKQHFWTHSLVDPRDTSGEDLTNQRRVAQRRTDGRRDSSRRDWRTAWLDWGAKQCAGGGPAKADPRNAAQVALELRNALADARITLTELAGIVHAIKSCAGADGTNTSSIPRNTGSDPVVVSLVR
jgi:hypothetical protein